MSRTARRVARGAVAGAVAGLAAALTMSRFQAVGEPVLQRYEDAHGGTTADDTEPSPQRAADALCRAVFGRAVPDIDKRRAGEAMHFAAGAAIGIGYGIAAEFAPRVTAGFGSALGLATALVLDDTIVPAAGWGKPVWQADAATNAYSHVSHLVFGWSAELVRRGVVRALALG